MALTDRQKSTVLANLQSKSKGICPWCAGRSWTMGDNVVVAMAAELPGGTLGIGGPFIPMIQVVCNSCGFVSHHAAALLGLDMK